MAQNRLTFADINEKIDISDNAALAPAPTKGRKATLEKRMRTMFAIDDNIEVFSTSLLPSFLSVLLCSLLCFFSAFCGFCLIRTARRANFSARFIAVFNL